MNFTTRLNRQNVSYIGANDYLGVPDLLDVDWNDKVAVIDWEFETERRDWGIKSMSMTVISVNIDIDFKVSKDFLEDSDIDHLKSAGFTEDQYDYIINKKLSSNDTGWKIENEVDFDKSVSISHVEIDFNMGTITLSK